MKADNEHFFFRVKDEKLKPALEGSTFTITWDISGVYSISYPASDRLIEQVCDRIIKEYLDG